MMQDPSTVQASSAAAASEPVVMPGETVRGIVSLLLVIHLFMLGVGVVSNRVPSQLESDLRTIPRPYLQTLCMDVSYSFHLTHWQPEDTDHFFEVDLDLADGGTKRILVPGGEIDPQAPRGSHPSIWPAIRFRRYERLAGTAATLDGNSAVEAIIPQAVAARLVAENNATGGVIRCRRHFFQDMKAVDSTNPEASDPFSASHYNTVFESRILVVNGAVQLLKIEAARDTAPAAQQP